MLWLCCCVQSDPLVSIVYRLSSQRMDGWDRHGRWPPMFARRFVEFSSCARSRAIFDVRTSTGLVHDLCVAGLTHRSKKDLFSLLVSTVGHQPLRYNRLSLCKHTYLFLMHHTILQTVCGATYLSTAFIRFFFRAQRKDKQFGKLVELAFKILELAVHLFIQRRKLIVHLLQL